MPSYAIISKLDYKQDYKWSAWVQPSSACVQVCVTTKETANECYLANELSLLTNILCRTGCRMSYNSKLEVSIQTIDRNPIRNIQVDYGYTGKYISAEGSVCIISRSGLIDMWT